MLIQDMTVVHNFSLTWWLKAMDGTSNSSFTQSPDPTAPALAGNYNEK